MTYNFVAPCLFGLESVLQDELRRIGAAEIQSDNGRVRFRGGAAMIARANLCLSTAERVLIEVARFRAETFTELFDGVAAIEWASFIGEHDAFPVKGHSLGSKLHSVPDCQSIIKKAVAQSLSRAYHVTWFEETGAKVQIQFSILKDQASVMIDTSGAGLHKRGYRPEAGPAPIKETLAAGICRLARVRPDSAVYDPFCGAGTLLIEAALCAMNIAPGLGRHFAAERYGFVPAELFKAEREAAFAAVRRDAPFVAYGSDSDAGAVELARAGARKIGVVSRVRLKVDDARNFLPETERGVVLCNPPYGERMGERENVEALYRGMRDFFLRREGFSYFIITSDADFEERFRPADRRRKLYNGMLKCDLYMYFK